MRWLIFMAIMVSAQDVPYYNNSVKKDQDLGGLNQNFRDLTNLGNSNTLRARDSVTGSTTPGDTCIDSPTFCIDATTHQVKISSIAFTGDNSVLFSANQSSVANSGNNNWSGTNTFTGVTNLNNTVKVSTITFNGQLIYTGIAPSIVSGCGTNARIFGNDKIGFIVLGSGPSAPCIFNWANAATTTWRKCTLIHGSAVGGADALSFKVGISSGQITTEGVALTAGMEFNWMCGDFNN